MANQVDVQRLTDEAIAKGGGEVKLPEGTYRLDLPLRIVDAEDVTIDGRGSTLVFTERRAGGIRIEKSHRCVLRNLAVDFDPVPFTQGEVIAMHPAGEWCDVAIDRGYDTNVDVFQQNLAMKVFDAKTRDFKREGRLMFPLTMTAEKEGIFRAGFPNGFDTDICNFSVGDLVAITSDRPSTGIWMGESESCELDGVTIFACPSAAVLEVGGGGHRYRYTITRGPMPEGATKDRLLSSCADGCWSAGTGRGAQFDGCLMEYVGDTGINIHGTYCKIVDISGRSLKFERVMGGVYFQAGDRLWNYSGDYRRKQAQTMIDAVDGGVLTVGSADGFAVGDLIISPDRVGSGAVIRNSTFREIECEMTLIRASDVLIENNTVDGMTFYGIYIGPEIGVYVEPDFVHHVTLRNNVLRNTGIGRWSRSASQVGLGAMNVGVCIPFGAPVDEGKRFLEMLAGNHGNTNIIVENNVVEDAAVCGLFILHSSGVKVRGNRFSRTNSRPPLEAGACFGIKPSAAIYVVESDHVTFEDNTVSDIGQYGDRLVAVDATAEAATIDTSGIRSE